MCSLGSHNSDGDVLNNLLIIQSDRPKPRTSRRGRANVRFITYSVKIYIHTAAGRLASGHAARPGSRVLWPGRILTRRPPRCRHTG